MADWTSRTAKESRGDYPRDLAGQVVDAVIGSVRRHGLSGDWTTIAPGVQVRLQDAPNEEDMDRYQPNGAVILEVRLEASHG